MANHSGFFLVIEGLDGSGKTEMARRVARDLALQFGENVHQTYEPHDPSCGGLFLRQVLTKKITADELTVALTFAANRLDHCSRVIDPFLNSSDGRRIVICDRYYLSSLVYQPKDDISIQEVWNLNRRARQPDLTLFLNASNKVCSQRMKKRDQEKELFEVDLAETREKYFAAIRYLRKMGQSIVEIDANGPLNDVHEKMISALNAHAPKWLTLQPTLALGYDVDVLNVNGVSQNTIRSEGKRVFESILPIHLSTVEDAKLLLDTLQEGARTRIQDMTVDELGGLFLDHATCHGFVVGQKLAWSDIDAFEVECRLPLSTTLHGVVILGNEIHKEMIVQRKLTGHLFDALSFVLLFLPAAREGASYFEREYIVGPDKKTFAPSIRRFYKDDMVAAIVESALDWVYDEFAETLIVFPALRAVLSGAQQGRVAI